jgi:uncharacterized protein YaaN involved in tellurite resistance
MSSVFAKISVKESPAPEVIMTNMGMQPTSRFPVAAKPSQMMQLSVISDADIDKIGENVSREIGQTTQKIIDKMAVGKFDELGAILTQISLEANKLDPSSLQKGGLVGWFQGRFTDVKGKLMMRLNSAQQVFQGLEEKISNHITVQQIWVTDLDSLYGENFNHYKKIVAEIDEVERLKAYAQSQIASWPEIDLNHPEAAMQAQLLRDAQTKVNRMDMKADNLRRLKAMTEINSPKIRSQQDTSRATISTLKDVITQTIPIIKMEFAMFLQTLDVQKSISLTSEVRNLATKTLTQGAEGAKMAAIASATAMNTPVITTQTLQVLRAKMLETVTEVNRVEDAGRTQRSADAVELVQGQKSLLTALTQSGKI